jgi:hypothetical protein
MSLLAERLLAVHDALESAGVPHAFGGAIAFAYCAEEPRGTRDVDVNVFTGPAQAREVLETMPAGVVVNDPDIAAAERDGQVRLWWEETPVDVFFDVHDFHRQAAAAVRVVPFLDRSIPVLGCTELVVFKARYNRTKDWADIEAMLEAGTIDRPRALRWVEQLLGVRAPEAERLAEVAARLGSAGSDFG